MWIYHHLCGLHYELQSTAFLFNQLINLSRVIIDGDLEAMQLDAPWHHSIHDAKAGQAAHNTYNKPQTEPIGLAFEEHSPERTDCTTTSNSVLT